MIDLHAHTTASDGSLSSNELIKLAHKIGLSAIGITDHDTTAGLPPALAAGKENKVEVVPGIELSVSYPTGRCHLLGYFIQHDNRKLNGRLEEILENRRRRNERLTSRLQDLGIPITLKMALEEAGGEVLARPHFALAMVRLGVVSNPQEAFDRYLGEGAAAYVPKDKISFAEGIELIHDAGGLAVLAHPLTLELPVSGLADRMPEMKRQGLDGIEALYNRHQPGDNRALSQIARNFGLLITGGSDFHGAGKPGVRLGEVVNKKPLDDEILRKLREKALSRRHAVVPG